MNNELLIYFVSSFVLIWGTAKFYTSKKNDEYSKSKDDSVFLADFEIIAESLGIILIGILSIMFTAFVGPEKTGSLIIYILTGSILFFLAIWSVFSINKTSSFLDKICPLVKFILASVYFLVVLS